MHRTSDYHFELPEAQIAQAPADRRDGSRLLVVGQDGLADGHFSDIVDQVPAEAVLVVNDTRVIAARLQARKATGGAVELFLVEPVEDDEALWRCLARASKPIRVGAVLDVLAGERVCASAEVTQERDEHGHIVVRLSQPALEVCREAGDMPLPPYIHRPGGSTPADLERYQTVYAAMPGAVAAPTAGLHFTSELLERLRARGIEVAPLTLHVGPGTFAPVRTEDVSAHKLHFERYSIPEATAALASSGRPVVAVGTTSVRALEASADDDGTVRAGSGRTDLFIRPGHHFRVVDHLITNFHLPESTLLMLVSAFAGYRRVMAAYRHAVATGYRFYSYGDSMFLSRMEDSMTTSNGGAP